MYPKVSIMTELSINRDLLAYPESFECIQKNFQSISKYFVDSRCILKERKNCSTNKQISVLNKT